MPHLFSNKSCLSINMNFSFSYSNIFLTSALIQKIEGIVKLSFDVMIIMMIIIIMIIIIIIIIMIIIIIKIIMIIMIIMIVKVIICIVIYLFLHLCNLPFFHLFPH